MDNTKPEEDGGEGVAEDQSPITTDREEVDLQMGVIRGTTGDSDIWNDSDPDLYMGAERGTPITTGGDG